MSDKHTHTWPDLAIGLYDRLTGNNAEIIYEFERMNISVPSGTISPAAFRVLRLATSSAASRNWVSACAVTR